MENLPIALTVLILSILLSEFKGFKPLCYLALLHGLALTPLTLNHAEGLAVRVAVSLSIFALLWWFTEATRVDRETTPSKIAPLTLAVSLAVSGGLLLSFNVNPSGLVWALSLTVGLFMALSKRDLFKVSLGVYVALDSVHGLFLASTGLASVSLFFDLAELAVMAVMLWTGYLVYKRYGTLDLWRANLLRW